MPMERWHVHDYRATTMRRLGWTGPAIDRIVIATEDAAGIEASSGANCIVARIQFDNRPEELTDKNYRDACLMAAAPDLYAALERMLGPAGYAGDNSIIQQAKAALAKARGETQ